MDYPGFFLANAEQFMADRQLSFADLDEVVNRQYSEAHLTLISSSPVHGIANSGSDIDLMCVTESLHSDQAMASQIYHGAHHMEVVAFARPEVERAFVQLSADADQGLAHQLAAYKGWDKAQPVSRKYLERLMCGVSTDQTLPYLHHQPALSKVWAASAFDDFRQSVCFSVLAWRCNEFRAAAAYACNAVLFLMNAILARHGWVNFNRKWTLLRWDRALHNLDLLPMDALHSRVDQLWLRTYPACRSGLDNELVVQLCELADVAEQSFACVAEYAALKPRVNSADSCTFLPGVEFVLLNDQHATLMSAFVMDEVRSTRPFDLANQPQGAADFLLSRSRAGLIDFSLTPCAASQGAAA
ncbi:DUF6001 family protein [Pseudomonas viridiflava]|uniref:DUF6001 family protein n=1 Tax=Pseudomonas viridiflava TaxID=33069 RepID=UPI0018E61CE2|nr:DUF6001 family protein [Pseudomonas viridiflava]MBI6705404.1 hypothetical protein [Pseudomonas viridiflava]MBI6725373.1 hypothetical protein [Pseudomonas viridiflava]